MDYGKFPRQRGAPASSIGAQQARHLETLGTPALRRRNADGSVSHKQGNHLWVTPGGQQLPDGFFTLGMVNGLTHVFASPNARGTFADRGPFMGDDGLVPWSVNRLYSQRRGWGLAVAGQSGSYEESTLDFNNYPVIPSWLHLAQTRNGRQFQMLGSYRIVHGWDGWSTIALFSVGTPARLNDGSELIAGLAVVAVTPTGDYVPVYVVEGINQVVLPTRVHQVMHDFSANLLSPRARLGVVRYTRAIYPQLPKRPGDPNPVDFPINNALNPGLDVYFSANGGAAWTWAGAQAVFSEFTATAISMDVPAAVAATGLWTPLHEDINTLYNRVLSATGVNPACPVSARYALALVPVGYVEPDPTSPIGWKGKRKIKVARIDNVARTITTQNVMLDTGLEESQGAAGSSVAIGGGMLFQLKPKTTPDYRDSAVQCWFVTLGGTPTLMGTMPQPAWLTGSLFAIDRNTAGCTTYEDGAYWVYESRDLGATWKRRACITKAPTPAKVAGANYLINFEYVTQLTNAGAMANPMPGAPWACDERMEAPVL